MAVNTFTDLVKIDFGLPWQRRFQSADNYKDWTDEQITAELEMKLKYENAAQLDPIQFGWTLEMWREVMENWATYDSHVICGGNRASKTIFCARLIVYLLMVIPEARLRCYHVNLEKSIGEQQAAIWDALPDRFKQLPKRKGTAHSIQYSQQNGFVGGKLILPPHLGVRRGSELIFGTYSQYKDDPQCVEGWWAHAIWGDEEMPLKMYERLLTRLYDSRGRLVLSFTTIQGWSPLVADLLGRTKTLKKRRSDLLKRDIPTAQESLNRRGTRIYYFWTQDNPWIPSETVEKLRGRPADEILAVAHGIPTKPTLGKFPKFDETVHVLPHDKMPWLIPGNEEQEYTRYHVVDPGGSKRWFMGWAAVDVSKAIYIYREWPDISFGAWGEQGESATGKAGPGQKDPGFGFDDYVETIKNAEEGEVVFERIIDPRMGANKRAGDEGATSIMSEMEDRNMTFIPAPGLHVDHGIALINDKLSYDETKPMSLLNSPKLYISDRCENIIEALKNYTGAGGDKEVWKDPIDVLRYLLENGADHVSKADSSATGHTFSY